MDLENRSIDDLVDLIERFFTAFHGSWANSPPGEALSSILAAVVSLSEKFAAVDHLAILKLHHNSIEGLPGSLTDGLTVVAVWDRRADALPISGMQYAAIAERTFDDLADGEILIGDPGKIGVFTTLIRSVVFLPLIVAERCEGVLAVGSYQNHAFSAREMRLFRVLASHLDKAVVQSVGDASTMQQSGVEHFPDKQSFVRKLDFFESLIANAADPIITLDLEGVIASFNRAAEKSFGYQAEEMIGQHISVLVPAHRRNEHHNWIQATIQLKHPIRGDTERVDKAGTILSTYVTMSPVFNGDSEVSGIAVFINDIGVRLTIQNNVRKERDLLEALLEATNDAILMVDSAGLVVFANLQFEVFFQISRFQHINHPIDSLVQEVRERPDLPSEFANILLTFVGDSYQSAGGDFEVTVPEARVLIYYSAPVYAHDGTNIGRLFVFRDATREREADRMKTEFVSLVSHELRTPTTSIMGFSELLMDGDAGPIDSTIKEYVTIINANANRLIALINNILDVTRLEAGHIELHRKEANLLSIVETAIRTVNPMLNDRQQKLTLDVESKLPPVWIDPERITQVVTNLLVNAAKYTPQQGALKLEIRVLSIVSELDPGTPPIFLPAILVGIHDTGMGIDPKDQPLLFTRFYRTEAATVRQITGTGLGLTIAKSFVELHGGHIWFRSQVDRGSSFYFTIPLVEGL